jgi:hypothetical protein
MEKLKTFLVETTTNDKWELCGGVYIVNAVDKDDVIAQLDHLPQPSTLMGSMNLRETITNISEIDSSERKVIFCQEPIVE